MPSAAIGADGKTVVKLYYDRARCDLRFETNGGTLPEGSGETEQVYFGATVTVCDLDGEDEQTYQIVGVDEANASEGRISWIAPLSRALLKAREGDVIRFASPAGLREIEVLEIRYA